MLKRQKHICRFAIIMLIFGFQLSGNETYAVTPSKAVSNINTFDLSASSELSGQTSSVVHSFQSQNQKQLIAELGEEEFEEVDEEISTSAKVAISHAYYSSLLYLNALHSAKVVCTSGARTLVPSTSLYLQFGVFRL